MEGERAYVLNNKGETEVLRGEDIHAVRDENQIYYEKTYIGAMVTVISTVEKIASDKTVFLEDLSYFCKAVVFLEGGWIVSVPENSDKIEALRSVCCDDSYIVRFEEYTTCSDSYVEPVSVSGSKSVYDVPVSGLDAAAAYAQLYAKYLQNEGFSVDGYTNETLNGETFQAQTFTSDTLGTVKMTLAENFVRVIVDPSTGTTITFIVLDGGALVRASGE